MKTKTKPPFLCSVCKTPILPHPISGWAGGNNAQPVNAGRCCDDCNNNVVIPLRLLRMVRSLQKKEG
jgi:hypothetical protein